MEGIEEFFKRHTKEEISDMWKEVNEGCTGLAVEFEDWIKENL